MAHQQLPDFDDERDNWKAYVIKAEAYFEATGVTESAKKRALLVAALSTRTVQILAGRVAPKKPNSLEYEDVVKVLDEFFDPKRHEITESFRFFNRCQLDGESVQEFITEIRRIADNCNFGTMLDRMLRDRIVCGIRSSALQKQLLTKKDLSVEDAETMALSAEAADKDANKMAADASAVLKIKAQSTSTKEVPVECGRCGSIKHNSNACRWSNARCYHCGRRGHLAVKCRNEESARPRTREGARGFRGRVLTVKEGETDEDIEDSMHIWTLKSTREVKVKPPIRRTFTWGGVDVSMLIDTGSPVCVVSRQLFEQHKNAWPSLRPSRTKLSCYLGKLPVFGELLLPVSYDNTTVECALVVLDCPGPSLCGRDLISLLSDAGSPVLSLSAKPLTAQPSTTTQVTADVFAEFPDVFSSDLGLIKGPPAHLQLKEGATPKFCKARSIPFALRDKVSEELDRLVALGVLSPVPHSEWATPIVPVLKKDGTVRICGDFKVTLNSACELEQYPLPVINDMFTSLSGGKHFSTLDLRDAYNQVPLDEQSRQLCVITTHKGLFCYNRLPFGIASAPAIFQRRMETVLQGLSGAQAYLDDVLVSERAGSDDVLKAVLQRFRESGVKLRLDKCKFRQVSVTYLGHRIDRQGLHPIEKNVEAITEAPSPKNVAELRSFLGMITFYSKFLPNISSLLAPLYRLLEKNRHWLWEQEQQTAFDKAKRCLQQAGVLVHFDPSQPLKLECDASQKGIGAVLFHTTGNVNKPIGFRSRTLSKAEKNYSQLEREALALVFGVMKFRDYLLGREFILVTDHQPLLGLLRPDRPTPPLAAARIQRWALYLGGFRYKLQYSPGKQLLNSDALSRLPQETSEPTTEGEPPDYVLALACVQEGVVSAEELQALTAGDPVLSKVMQYTRDGWPSSSKALERSLLPFYDRRLELSLAHRLLYWGRRVVIPVNAQHRMLHMLHETHQGSSAMKSIARSAFWWPGMDHDIEQLSAGCTSCIQNRPMPVSAPPVNWPTCQENWSRVHLDFAGPIKGSMILVLVDAHSKWIEAVPMKQATTSSTITCLRSIFGRFGIPRTIVSDNGTQFTSQEFADFANNNNITHLRTAAFHPQSNGLAERAVRTVKDGLKKMNQGRLEDCLCRLLFNYRRTPLASGKSPSELLLGYQIRSRLDTCFPPLAAERSGTSDDWTLAPDTNVYVRNFGKGDKWKTGTVKSADGARMVTVETPEGLVRRHVDQVHTRKDPPATQGHRESERSSISKTPQQTPGAGPKANAETRETSPPQRQSSPQPLDAPERNREPTVATELRRSTRERRPVQRLQYY